MFVLENERQKGNSGVNKIVLKMREILQYQLGIYGLGRLDYVQRYRKFK